MRAPYFLTDIDMIDLDPASPARRHAGWRPTNAAFYARLDAIRERQLPPYRPQWLREEQRRAEEQRQAKAQVADKLSFDDSTQLVRLRADIAWMRFELAMLPFAATLHGKALPPSGYDPEQPRVPRGNPDGGQWTRVAGGPPGVGHNQGPPLDEPPKVPEQRPERGKERNAVIKPLARWLARTGGPIGLAIQVGSWIQDDLATIEAYRDPPKSLEELREAVNTPKAGYDIHHIVEQTSAERDGYPREMIDGPENLVRIPRLKHWEINGWMETRNEIYDGLSPREYVRGKTWEERFEIGRRALIVHGVLP